MRHVVRLAVIDDGALESATEHVALSKPLLFLLLLLLVVVSCIPSAARLFPADVWKPHRWSS
jgi:hypothetical protein